jgi:hypothetical protein
MKKNQKKIQERLKALVNQWIILRAKSFLDGRDIYMSLGKHGLYY